MLVTSLYSSLLAIIFLILTIKVIRIRKTTKITIGDNNNQSLQKAIRAQGNFAETVPLALILLALSENLGTSMPLLHISGFTLLLGRMIHSYGISCVQENFNLRIAGMSLTIFSIAFLTFINLSRIII